VAPVTPSAMVRFPRSRERGPIEAMYIGLMSNPDATGFRAHVSAAPLKQLVFVQLQQVAAWFPRSRERGPIEARPLNYLTSSRSSGFRAHVSAAPLKHALARQPPVRPAAFPRSRERGPIEASLSRSYFHRAQVVSALT